MKTRERKVYLDILRILACYLVIFNHTSGYHAFLYSGETPITFYYMFFTMITKINVPLFFMLSGSLLLSRDMDYKNLFCKRIVRILAALALASFAVYGICMVVTNTEIDLMDFIRRLLSNENWTTYWFLYAYLGFLVSQPLLRRIAAGFTHADAILLLVLHFAMSALPVFNTALTAIGYRPLAVTGSFDVPLMTVQAFFYPLIGYYFDNVFDIRKINIKTAWILPAVALAGIFAESAVTWYHGVTTMNFTQDFVQTLDFMIAIPVFLAVKAAYLHTKKLQYSENFGKITAWIGSLTFGIYLIAPLLEILTPQYFSAVVTTSDPMIYSVLWCLYSMLAGGAVTAVLKKIPVIRTLF